jgi:DNA-directed RNA polymerase subunit beta'
VVEDDCGTMLGVEVEPLLEGGEVIQRLSERILGRTTVNDVLDPFTDEVVVRAGREIDENDAQKIENAGVTTVLIRSVPDLPHQIWFVRQMLWPGPGTRKNG